MRTWQMLVSITVIGMSILVGCSDDSTKPNDDFSPTYLRPTSPENVIVNLVSAYQNRDIDAYRDAIADVFEFRANPGAGYGTLNKSEDEGSVSRMFEEAIAIQVRLDNSGATDSDYLDEFPSDDGYRQIVVPAARLEVTTSRDEGQGPITYLVDGDRALFMLKETSAGVWQIVMQEDQS